MSPLIMLRLCLFTNIVLAAAECAPGGNCSPSSTGTSLLQSKQTIDKLKLVEHTDVQAEVVANWGPGVAVYDASGRCNSQPCRWGCPIDLGCTCMDFLAGSVQPVPGYTGTAADQMHATSTSRCNCAKLGVRTCSTSWPGWFPTSAPTSSPTDAPTSSPTPYPTLNPTPTPTPNPTPNPTPMPTQHITIDFGNVKQNNLGGLGPDSGDAELRFGTVATLGDGSVVDLVVTTGSSYDPVQPKANGKKAEFAKINQASGGSYEYTFSFQEAATGESIKIDSFSMSFVDVDGDAQKEVKETVSVCGASSLRMANITHLQSSADGECYTIVPTSLNASENVQSLATMTEIQKAHAFTATFSQTSTFTIKTIVSASLQELPQQRALVFAGVAIDF